MNVKIFSALADPNRFGIVELLREGPLPVGNIAERLELSQPQTSKHLRVLTEAGLVQVEPSANKRIYPAGVYGHLGPVEGSMIPPSAFPFFAREAKGAYFWDVDGNRFIDYMCAYGPNILGYRDDDVDQAARAQGELGDCVTLPSVKMIEFAELLVDTVHSADWAFFAKNGGDVTSFALMIARAATGRNKAVLVNKGYHGVAPWTKLAGNSGIAPEEIANNLYVDWNNIGQLEALINAYPGQIACFIASPYFQGNFTDNQLPEQDYWQKVRSLCTIHGIVLIIDDVRCGFRLDLAGSDHHYGFEADLLLQGIGQWLQRLCTVRQGCAENCRFIGVLYGELLVLGSPLCRRDRHTEQAESDSSSSAASGTRQQADKRSGRCRRRTRY